MRDRAIDTHGRSVYDGETLDQRNLHQRKRAVMDIEHLGRRATKNPDRDSGVNGVYWHKKNQKWVARLKTNGIWIYLGSHLNLDEAVAARRRAEAAYGFHPNHGRRPATRAEF